MRDWVHEFARDVIRPAAAEWDEREETPWPILEEAAKIGLYSLDFFAAQWFEPSRARHGRWRSRSCSGATPGSGCRSSAPGWPRSRWRQRDARADRRVAAADVRQPGRRQAGRVLLVRAGRGQRRRRDPDPRGLRRGQRRVGAQRHQDLGDQRRHRQRARRRRLGRPGARQPGPGDASSCRPARKGLSQGQKFRKHGIRASHTAEVVLDDVRVPGRCLVGGKEKLDARLARLAERRQRRRAGRDEDVRGVAAVGRRDGGRGGAGGVRVRDASTRRTRVQFGRPIGQNQGVAFKLADMARVGRRGPAADLARGLDGPARASSSSGPRARCPSWSRGRPRSG